jgi:2-(1,2-epoxy-1,2-dihydrophenyl)acetyl-CoA isomerase
VTQLESEVLLAEQKGGVLIITLDRPATLNALNRALLLDLLRAFELAATDDSVRCVVLTGAGRGFCSGADLSDLGTQYEGPEPPSLGAYVRELYSPLVLAIRRIEKPVIAALNGIAAGGGASLALACDLRIASDRASIAELFVRIGLLPDTGGTIILPLLVGLGKAAELAFSGARIGAAEAERIGLVNRVVPADDLVPATLAWAAELAALPTRAIGLTKRGFNAALLPHLEQHLELEAQLMDEAGRTADHREGVLAFREKREPKFVGA